MLYYIISSFFLTFLDYCNIPKFLNRLLGVEVELQNSLFLYFTTTLAAVIQRAKRNGKYDEGILGALMMRMVMMMMVVMMGGASVDDGGDWW